MNKRKLKKRSELSDAITIMLEEPLCSDILDNDVLIGISSIVGTREEQQDACYADKIPLINCTFAVLCDGMGGLSGGALASRTAVDFVSGQFTDNLVNCDENEKDAFNIQMLKTTSRANDIVKNLKTADGGKLDAGTTMVAVVIKDGYLYWNSVGDSKIYLLKNGIFRCLTNEHNYRFMAEQKKYDSNFRFDASVREDALVSYLGAESLKYVDTNAEPFKLDDGDVILLCSDGLYKSLKEKDIVANLINEEITPEEIAENLTSDALKKSIGSQDNTTVIVLKYKEK